MKLVFIGASQFGLKCLRTLENLSASTCIELVGVVTAPKKFPISYSSEGVVNVLHADIGSYCENHKIPYVTLGRSMKEEGLFDVVTEWKPEMFLVVGWYHMLPKQWLDLAPAYGLHASLLPDYSGGAPLVWAMINGEKTTGITLFAFDSGVDSGPIVSQLKTAIEQEDTIATLYQRIEELGIKLLSTHLPKLANGTAVLKEQEEWKRRVYPQRSPTDGLIDWKLPANKIYDFIRAQTKPYPGAFSYFRHKKLVIWECKLESPDWGLQPGEVAVGNDSELILGCGHSTAIQLTEVSLDHEMPIPELIAQLNLRNGDSFNVPEINE